MNVGILIKIAAVGILVTILSQLLNKNGKEEYAYLLGLGALILVLGWILPYLLDLFQTIETMFRF